MHNLLRASGSLLACIVALSTAGANEIHVSIDSRSEQLPPLRDLAIAARNGTAFAPSDTGSGLTCYNKCYGVSREVIVEAINWFCTIYDGQSMNLPGDAYTGTWEYSPNLHVWVQNWFEEGQIAASISIPDDEVCGAPVVISYDQCFRGLIDCVDGCNTNGENYKQGGYDLSQPCLKYDLNPNPYCSPECLTSDWTSDPKTCSPASERDTQQLPTLAVRSPEGTGTIVGAVAAQVLPGEKVDTVLPPPTANDLNVNCYDQCYGIDRAEAIKGIYWFCAAFSNWVLRDSLTYAIGTWNYTASQSSSMGNGAYEEGIIRMEMNVPGDCGETYMIPSQTCAIIMRDILDGCNTETENGKQGGDTYVAGCIKFDLNTNPLCWPQCLASPSIEPIQCKNPY